MPTTRFTPEQLAAEYSKFVTRYPHWPIKSRATTPTSCRPTTSSAAGDPHRKDQTQATPRRVSRREARAIDEWNRMVLESWEAGAPFSPPTQIAHPAESKPLREFATTAVFSEALRRLLSPLLRGLAPQRFFPTALCAWPHRDPATSSSQAPRPKGCSCGTLHSNPLDNPIPPPDSAPPAPVAAAFPAEPGISVSLPSADSTTPAPTVNR